MTWATSVPIFGFLRLSTPLSVWPHLFRAAGHEKRRGEQLEWSLAFTLYIGSFPCAQLPGPVHTARLGRVCFNCVFSLGLYFVHSFVFL